MRYLSSLALMAVAVFLIGTSSTEVLAKRPSNPPELEQRVTDLETRMDSAEGRLYTLEQNQSDLQSDVTDHEARITALEGLSFGAALGVFDANEVFLGLLVDFRPDVTLTVFNPDIPAHFKVVTKLPPYIEPNNLGIIAFDGAGCSGQMYSGIAGERHQFSLMYDDDNNDNYYVFDNAVAAINHDENDPNPTLKSCFWIDDNTCNGSCFSGLYAVLKPVSLPPGFETLAYPITVRPIQQP